MTRYVGVDDQKAAGFPVTVACEAVGVSTSGYYDWAARQAAGPTERQLAEAELVALMRELFDAADGNYGVPRMDKALRHAGLVVNVKGVARLMRLHGMAGRFRRRSIRTTFPGPDGYVIPDLVGRRFAPGAPDVAWCQDITYIPTGEGWLYLASVLDLGSRRLLGYSMADHIRTELVLPGPPTAPLGRKDRYLLGQRGGRELLGEPEAGMSPRTDLLHPGRGSSGHLPVDQLVQHVQASHHPQRHTANRVGAAVPSSFIITRPDNGEMPNFGVDRSRFHPAMTQHSGDLGEGGTAAQHLGSRGVMKPVGAEDAETGAFGSRPHDLAHPFGRQSSQRCRHPQEGLPLGPSRTARTQVGGHSPPDVGWQRQPFLAAPFPPDHSGVPGQGEKAQLTETRPARDYRLGWTLER